MELSKVVALVSSLGSAKRHMFSANSPDSSAHATQMGFRVSCVR